MEQAQDTIYRQAALKLPITPKEHREYQTFNLDDAYEQGWNDLQKCIESLPSAQSEQRWIPVTERLPEENTPVLLGVRFKDDFKYFVTARVDYNYWTGLGRDIRGELAWMPLPKAWKGERE